MTRRFFYKLYFLGVIALSGICISLLLLLGFLQTKTAQAYMTQWIIDEAKKNGFSLEITGFSGMAPLKWSCEEVALEWNETRRLELKNAQVRIALLPLFKGQLSLSFLKIDFAHLSFPSWRHATAPFTDINLIDLPFHLSAKTIKIEELIITDLSTDKSITLQIAGNAKLHKELKEIQTGLSIYEPAYHNQIALELLSSQKKELIKAEASFILQDSANLSSFFDLKMQASGVGSVKANGKWHFWYDLKNRIKKEPLCFFVDAKTEHIAVAGFECLNTPWHLQTKFSLWPDLSSSCEDCRLESDFLHFLGKVSLSSSFTPVSCSAIVRLSSIERLQPILPIGMTGSVQAKIGLKEQFFLFSANSSALSIGSELFTPASFKIEAIHKGFSWLGNITCNLQNQELPWLGSCDFSLKEKKAHITDLSLQANQAKISGTGLLYLPTKACKGSFFVHIPELRSFRLLFPSSDLDGKVGGEFNFSYYNHDLNAAAHLLIKNARYQSSLLDTMRLDFDGKKLLSNPLGTLQVDCENLLTKWGQIASLSFSSHPTSEEKQEFSLEAVGNWKKDFSLASIGCWEKTPNSWSIQCTKLEGTLFNLPFFSSPFSFGKTENSHFLRQAELNIGEGFFSLDYQIAKKQAMIQTQGKHLPLHVISLFYPSILVKGSASFEGAFSGVPTDSYGHFIASLEEATVSHMQAKGSLQLHLSQKLAQIHAHLYATQNQFLDWTASVPIGYSYDPFAIFPVKTGPLSSEVTMQGAIEDLLGFIQTANQKVSGWVTCHQILSGSLQSPRLQGDVSLQGGSYENYFSGMKLKDISLQGKSTGDAFQLTQMQASDGTSGLLNGKGSLLLDRAQSFPYAVEVNLDNVNLIQSDILNATAKGPIVITGDMHQAKAAGELALEKTFFSLAESLPAEIPTLAIEYIHKPVHLQRSEIFIRQEYPFKLELLLSADNTATLKGKGLDSLWSGNLLLTGSPTNPIAKGNLVLQKGEFKFSGKTFTLMQGDLSFSDKSDQKGYLKLIGQLQMPSATIVANMQGPLSSPRLTFSSTPALPTSSILSLILFNKDISEISPMQAIQLAQVIMSLSGSGGPDVLEAIRRSLGVDRLNIVEKDGSDEISLQIGWYLTHGITVSLSQSASSSDITIEVDLKHGFTFEAETQNQEEGKFSLKWNCNY
jgi:hypothetical protein